MAGIVLFGGTAEGRRIAEAFRNTGVRVDVCVATEYGASLLPVCENIIVHAGRMGETDMEGLLSGLKADYCLDATHPYAAEVTANLVRACAGTQTRYIRICRKEEAAFASGGDRQRGKGNAFVQKESIAEAAAFLKGQKGNILITTGSRDLERYTVLGGYRERCFVRVLPAAAVIEKCLELGFAGKNLIAMQGPFTQELNYALLKQIDATWMVTKNSGKEGGFQDKCEAALRAGVNIIVIGRPKEERTQDGESVQKMEAAEAVRFLKRHFGMCLSPAAPVKRKVCLIGMGPGSPGLMTREAEECLEQSDVVIGAERTLAIWPGVIGKPFYTGYRKEEIITYLQEHEEYRCAAILYSGDIGFYSGAKGLRELLEGFEVRAVPGIASPVYFLDRIGVPWDSVFLVSCHGRKTDLLAAISRHGKVCALAGGEDMAADICRQLTRLNWGRIRVTVGERLSYPEERITTGSPEQLCGRRFDRLSVVLFENPSPCTLEERDGGFCKTPESESTEPAPMRRAVPGIEDSLFIRGGVPMTKQEVRVLSLSKLKLLQDSVLYDIGAGTGSVSVEAALLCGKGTVYAIERNQEAVELLKENRSKFKAENLIIIEGEAPGCMDGLPAPTHVFIGGSGGGLLEIVGAVREKNPQARFTVNAVTLETIARLGQLKEAFPEYAGMELIQVNIARSRALSGYHMLDAANPIVIAAFGGEKEEGCGE